MRSKRSKVGSKFNRKLESYIRLGCNEGGVDEELREKLVAVKNEVESQLYEFMRLKFFVKQNKIELPKPLKKEMANYSRSVHPLYTSIILTLIGLGCLERRKAKMRVRMYSKRVMVLGSTLRDIQRKVSAFILTNTQSSP